MPKHVITIGMLVVLAIVYFVTGGDTGLEDTKSNEKITTKEDNESPLKESSNTKKVTVVDRGLQMPISRTIIPATWELTQNIARDPNTGSLTHYQFDLTGPDGQIIRGLGTSVYHHALNTNFNQILEQMTSKGLSGLGNGYQFGSLRGSEELQRSKQFRELAEKLQRNGSRLEGLEVPFTGTRNGTSYQGMVYVSHITTPSTPGTGTVSGTLIAAPNDAFSESVELNKKIAESTSYNPAYQKRVEQLGLRAHQQRMARNQAAFQAHQQRMARNQAAFDAHQRTMRGISQQQDQAHAAFMGSLSSGGSGTTTSSGYNSHNAYVDSIHERNTFHDPDSGQERSFDGQYDRNFTDGLGNFVGTDDPSFDKHSLQGDWNEVKPLQPNNW